MRISFYPDCGSRYLTDTEISDNPVIVFGGLLDDANPVAKCVDYVGRVRAAGATNIDIVSFPGAHHVFDNVLGASGATPNFSATTQTGRNCFIEETETGLLINTATQQPFSYSDACVEVGQHTAYNPEASTAARAMVSEMLARMSPV